MSIRELPKLKLYVVDYKHTDKYSIWDAHRIFDDKLAAMNFNKLMKQREDNLFFNNLLDPDTGFLKG
tara:strand:+ start:977 stop:1177 length:201 start_codon:yes stop_codon:yes gene_type:complete